MKRVCENLCPKFQVAMSLLAKPWNGLIIASLESGPARFCELLTRLGGCVGDRMLSERLKELQARGIVERRALAGPPVRVEYELTDAGREFRAVADAVATWGAKLETEHGDGPHEESTLQACNGTASGSASSSASATSSDADHEESDDPDAAPKRKKAALAIA